MTTHAPYFKWFPKDYASDALVRGMTDAQDLAYRRLIDASWEIGALPSEPEKLAVLAQVDSEGCIAGQEFLRQVWTYPLTECWAARKDGLLINYRLEEERDKAFSRADSATKAVQARETKRRKLLRQRKKKPIIVPPSRDHRKPIATPSTPDPPSTQDPVPKTQTKISSVNAPTKQKGGEASKESEPPSPNGIIRWNHINSEFDGDKPRLREALFERYLDNHGEKWVQAVFKSCRTWCIDHPDEIRAKKNHYQFVLGWFRREAQDKEAR